MKPKLLVLLMLIALLVTQVALAKGPPQKVTISGGDLAEEIEITGDEATLNALAMMTLEDYRTRSDEAPSVEGDGYFIARYYMDSRTGRYIPFDELRYFPDPEGGRGYINYVGIVNGSSEYDGEWFRTNLDSEAVLQAVIDGSGGESASAEHANLLRIFFQSVAQFIVAQ